MARLLISLALLVLLALPAGAAANRYGPNPLGGVSFSSSDRGLQAAGDTLAIAPEPRTGGVVALGQTGPGRRYVYRFATSGRQTARFAVDRRATALAVGPAGQIVLGTSRGQVLLHDAEGRRTGAFTAASEAIVAMTAAADGSLYAATRTGVTRHTPAGAPTGAFGTTDAVERITGIAVDGAGRLYVADIGRRRVAVFAAGGALERVVGGIESLEQPWAVAVDSAGGIYVRDVSDRGFDVKLFAPDGTLRGSVTAGWFDTISRSAQDRASEPVLIAFGRDGDLYYTPGNPDLMRIPATALAAPRFRFDDADRAVPQYDDAQPLAITAGREIPLDAAVFPSLSSGLRARLRLSAGLTLTGGGSLSAPVTVPPGEPFTRFRRTLRVERPGRFVADLTVAGTAPGGIPARMRKRLPIYGLDGPRLRIEGAATRPGEGLVLVAIGLDLGSTRIRARDRERLFEHLNTILTVDATARVGGRPARGTDFSIGEALNGTCVPFRVSGTPALRVTATLSGSRRVTAAPVTRTVRPTTRPRTALLRECYEALDLA